MSILWRSAKRYSVKWQFYKKYYLESLILQLGEAATIGCSSFHTNHLNISYYCLSLIKTYLCTGSQLQRIELDKKSILKIFSESRGKFKSHRNWAAACFCDSCKLCAAGFFNEADTLSSSILIFSELQTGLYTQLSWCESTLI